MGGSYKKVTVSLPEELVEYADRLARESSTSRSAVIADLLEWRRARVRDALAREGYAFYGDEAKLGAALAGALNVEIRALAGAGCTWIQVDEPVFARYPEKALAFGIDNLSRCFEGVPESTVRGAHVCCGYPAELDTEDYPKADPRAYLAIADGLEAADVDVLSIEDAHRHNDLALLERFTTTRIALGVIGIARTRVEPVDEIADRLRAALAHIDAKRLIAAPDCGLTMLDRDTARAKLANLAAAAKTVG